MVSIEPSSVSRHEIVLDRGWLRSTITDHRKEELFHPGSALDLGTRQGTRHRGGVTGKRGRVIVMPIMLFVHVLVMFPAVVPVLVPF